MISKDQANEIYYNLKENLKWVVDCAMRFCYKRDFMNARIFVLQSLNLIKYKKKFDASIFNSMQFDTADDFYCFLLEFISDEKIFI